MSSIFAHILAGLSAIFRFLQFTGRTAAEVGYSVISAVFGFVFKLVQRAFGYVWELLVRKFKQPLYDLWCFIITPIAHAYGALANVRIQFKKSRAQGKKQVLKTVASTAGRFGSGLWHGLKRVFNYAAPVACICFLFALISYASSVQYTISVEYNGNNLGVINSEADYNQAQALMQDKITYTEDDDALIETPTFSVRPMSNEDVIVDTNSLSELMMSQVGVVDAYGLYINGTAYGIYDEAEIAKVREALDSRLAAAYTEDAATVEFEDDVEITPGRYLETNLTNADDAVAYITGAVNVEAYYVAQSGDSLSLIASKLGCTQDELLTLNPSMSDGIRAGDIIAYRYSEPNMSVVTTHYESYDRVIEVVDQFIYDDDIEQYCEELKQKGSAGYENVTALVTETDGVETSRQIVSSYNIEEMVPNIYIVGTAENESLEGDTHVIDRLGTFVWPVGGDGGYVSSLYGYRSWDNSNHRAIDIAADRGTDIYAAADGVVTFAGTYSSYGKLVIIDHGGGYETYYAHQSSIDVEKGDVVQKGDVIGHVGMTGSASGNHLHFELRYNNDRIDPMLCLGGVGDHTVWE